MNKATLRESLRTLFWPGLEPEQCPLVLHNGRRSGRTDTDLFVITHQPPPCPYCVLGAVDMALMDVQRSKQLLGLFDPVVTEPVLTGERLLGPDAELETLRRSVQAQRSSTEIVNYLRRRGLEELLSVTQQAESVWGESEVGCVWTLQNLSFAISYLSFARYYEKNDQVTTICTLQESGALLWPEFWIFRDRAKRRPAVEELRVWLERVIRSLSPE